MVLHLLVAACTAAPAALQASAGLVATAAFLPLAALGGWVAKRNAAAGTPKKKGDSTPPPEEELVVGGPPQEQAGATTTTTATSNPTDKNCNDELPGHPEDAKPCPPPLEGPENQSRDTTATARTPTTTTTTEFHDDFVIVKYTKPASPQQGARAAAGARAKHVGEGAGAGPAKAPKTKRRVVGVGKGVGKTKANAIFGSRFRDRVGDALERSVRGLEDQWWAASSAAEDRACAGDEAKASLEEVETCLLQVETQVGGAPRVVHSFFSVS